jgi:DNA-binding GntR family transcriptional regulator
MLASVDNPTVSVYCMRWPERPRPGTVREQHVVMTQREESQAVAEGQVERPDYRGLSEWVVLKVIDGVRKGTFVPGERLLEEDLARRFAVSRAPVRDAMHRLENLGVVERKMPRGVFVTHWTADDRAEVLAIVDALILASVQLAVHRLVDADFEALGHIIVSIQAEVDGRRSVPDLAISDAAFHRIIAVASGNRRLVDLLENLSIPLGLYGNSDDYFSPEEWLRIHTGLLETLRLRDEDAAVARVCTNRRESMDILLRSHDAAPREAAD